MEKRKFEEYERLEELITMGLGKVNGVVDKTWKEISREFDDYFSPEAISRFIKYINLYKDLKVEEEDIEKLIEIKKERRKMQDQRRELNRSITELARMESLKQDVLEILENKDPINIFQEPISYEVKKREGVLVISDVHYGIEVENELNIYNPDVCRRNFEEMYYRVAEYVEMYGVRKLTIVLAGDLVSGIIHTSLRLQQREDIISQIEGVAEILEVFLANLKNIVDIEVRYTIGNHSRVMADKKLSLSSENFEHLIAWHLERMGIKVIEAKSDLENFDVCGYNVSALHGHQTKPENAFSYVTTRSRVIPDYIIMAHYHTDKKTEVGGCQIICNGSMVGTDEYAIEKGYYSIPHQKLIVFEVEQGEIATIKINFRR